jgi:predicted RNA-binding Zn ribbon-like protein
VSSDQHDAAVRFRDSLRRVIAQRGDPDFGSSAKPFPLRVGFEAGTPTLLPQAEGAIAGVAQILAAVIRTTHAGDWDRVKICPADSCQVAFFDESRNRSRAWCSMKVCGNRTKTRAYRARHPQS